MVFDFFKKLKYALNRKSVCKLYVVGIIPTLEYISEIWTILKFIVIRLKTFIFTQQELSLD